LELAPRDPRLRAAWRDAVTIPADVRRLAPIVPASRDELLLAALVLWLALWVSLAVRWRTLAWSLGAATVVILAIALARVRAAPTGRALVTVNGVLRISPQSAMESTGEVQAWALVHIDRRNRDWVLVTAEPATGTTGSMGPVALQGWIPAASVAEIDPVRPMIRRSTPDGR
ncbi:MAG: hypothetical protein ACRELE_06210, partial [Gemmatimonadales bacterium]